MDVLFSLLSGSVAGLLLAAPLGAIGILLIQEGVTRGLRQGLPSAAGVATVDVLYCAVAVAAGALAGPIVGDWTPWPQIVGGSAVIVVGVIGLVKSRRGSEPVIDQTTGRARAPLQRYVVFVGLTALNPATLVYFAAIVSGLDQFTQSLSTSWAFVMGVGIASFGWQALLVAIGAALRRRTGPSFRGWTTVIGNGLVVALGITLLAQAR